MARRQLGHGRGGRMKIERDAVEVRSGVRHGRTLGSPIALLVANRDYENWEERMNPWPVDAEVEESHLPRPGHADLVGSLEVRASTTSATCSSAPAPARPRRGSPPGALAKEFLAALGVSVHSHVLRIASVEAPEPGEPRPAATSTASTSRRCAASTPRRRRRWSPRSTGCARRTRASAASSRSGPSGSFRASARTSPGTSGSTAASPRRVVSIQAVKGVSVGEAWEVAAQPRLGVARRDLLVGRARLSPRDQPRRRDRGRDDERRAAGRPRRAEADLDPDQAAALGRHRDQAAGAGDARAHRLDRRPRRRGGRRGDGRAGAGAAATARSSAATTSTTFSPPSQAYRERIEWRR